MDTRICHHRGSADTGTIQRGSIEQHVNGCPSNPPTTVPAAKRSALFSHSYSHSSIPSALSFHQDNQSSLSGIGASSWMDNDKFSLLQHLHQHACIYGLDVSSLGHAREQQSNSSKNVESGNTKDSSGSGDNTQHPAYLSWRKLHLSKAKLKTAKNTSALLAGFAMVAMVEIQFKNNNDSHAKSACVNGIIPTPLLMIFATCTTLLVAIHMLALLISTCILPNLEAIVNLHNLSLVHESPHEKMHTYIELAWGCSTVLGIFLFMIEVTILCWIQFYCLIEEAAYIATAILVLFVILFIWFTIKFYRNLTAHTYETRKAGIKELEELKTVIEMQDYTNA